MSIIAGHKIRITAGFQLSGVSAVENVFDFDCSLSTGQPDSDAMAIIAAGLEIAYSPVLARVSTALVCTEIRGFNITADAPLPTVSWPSLTAGVNTGDLLPFGVAALVVFRTGKARVMGRKYIGGWTETENDTGEVVAGSVSALAQFGAELVEGDNFDSENWEFQYVVRDQAGVAHFPEEVVVRSVWSYQRRRKQGVGV